MTDVKDVKWKFVPEFPDSNMVRAGDEAISCRQGLDRLHQACAAYRSMVAAAPTPPQQEALASIDRAHVAQPSASLRQAEAERDAMTARGDQFKEAMLSFRQAAEVEQARARELSHMLERDRTAVADAVDSMQKAIRAREWLRLGRGSYEYDDDRWRGEFGEAIDAIMAEVKKLEKVAADWEGCPRAQSDIAAARKADTLDIPRYIRRYDD